MPSLGRRAVVASAAAFVAAPAIARAAPQGRLESRSFPSAALGRDVAYTVYRPAEGPPRLPVIQLLHGLGGNERDWFGDGGIAPVLDALIADGTIPPVLVVTPRGDSGWYVDSKALGGPGDWGTAIGKELQYAIARDLPADTAPGRQAIGGLSMGGYGALRFAFSDPARWSAVAVLSPAIWQNVPREDLDLPPLQIKLLSDSSYFHVIDPATVTLGVDLPPPGQHFSGAFGAPFDARRYNALNPFTLLARAVDDGQPLPPVFIAVGDDDDLKLERGSIALFETLRADSRSVELRVLDGGHDWRFWKAAAPEMLRFLGTSLAKSGATP